MASIPGPVFFGVGVAVSAVSFFLNKKTFGFIGPYSLFLYLGIILLVYGLAKTLIWYMTRKTEDERKEEITKTIAKKEETQTESAFDKVQKDDFDKDRYRLVAKCKNCGLLHYSYANFCQNCGSRLR